MSKQTKKYLLRDGAAKPCDWIVEAKDLKEASDIAEVKRMTVRAVLLEAPNAKTLDNKWQHIWG
jgi:hypothetical protein